MRLDCKVTTVVNCDAKARAQNISNSATITIAISMFAHVFVPNLHSTVGCVQTLWTDAHRFFVVFPPPLAFEHCFFLVVVFPPPFAFGQWRQKRALPFLNFFNCDFAKLLLCNIFLHWVHAIISTEHTPFLFATSLCYDRSGIRCKHHFCMHSFPSQLNKKRTSNFNLVVRNCFGFRGGTVGLLMGKHPVVHQTNK